MSSGTVRGSVTERSESRGPPLPSPPPPRTRLFDHRYRSTGTINTSSWRIDSGLLGRGGREGGGVVLGSVHQSPEISFGTGPAESFQTALFPWSPLRSRAVPCRAGSTGLSSVPELRRRPRNFFCPGERRRRRGRSSARSLGVGDGAASGERQRELEELPEESEGWRWRRWR